MDSWTTYCDITALCVASRGKNYDSRLALVSEENVF